jgi:hypothetical protein
MEAQTSEYLELSRDDLIEGNLVPSEVSDERSQRQLSIQRGTSLQRYAYSRQKFALRSAIYIWTRTCRVIAGEQQRRVVEHGIWEPHDIEGLQKPD